MGQAQERCWLDFPRLYQEGVIVSRVYRRKRKLEFSKKILLFAAIVNIVVIVFTLVMIWRTCDLSPLAYLIPAVAAGTATGTGFYYAKAKVENRIKLMKQNNVEVSQHTFNDIGGLG